MTQGNESTEFFRFQWELQWENDQKYKMAKNHFSGSKMVPKVFKWGFLGGIFVLKSGLRILIRAPEVPFSVPPK